MRNTFITLTAAALLLTTGCQKSAQKPSTQPANQPSYTQDAVAAGGTLNSDGSVTNQNGTITEPNGQIVPANGTGQPTQALPPAAQNTYPPPPQPAPSPSAPSQPAPIERVAPAPPPAPVAITAPAGTRVVVRINEELSSERTPDGTRWTGVLAEPIEARHTVVFDRGTPVAGVVVSEKNKGRFKGAGDLGIVVTAIGRDTVHTSEYVAVAKGKGRRTGAFIGGGGGLGALIGGLAGGGKGALIGGLAGAGAGTAASATGNRAVIIRPETVISFRLREAVTR